MTFLMDVLRERLQAGVICAARPATQPGLRWASLADIALVK